MSQHQNPTDSSSNPQEGEGPNTTPAGRPLTPEEKVRVHRLYDLWINALCFFSDDLAQGADWTHPTPEREAFVDRLNMLLNQFKKEYPGVNAAPMPNSELMRRSIRALQRAKRLRRAPMDPRLRDRLNNDEGLRTLELVTRIRAQSTELCGLVNALMLHPDPIHRMAMFAAYRLLRRVQSEDGQGPTPG